MTAVNALIIFLVIAVFVGFIIWSLQHIFKSETSINQSKT